MSNVLLRYFDSGKNALFKKSIFGLKSDVSKNRIRNNIFESKYGYLTYKRRIFKKIYFLDKNWKFCCFPNKRAKVEVMVNTGRVKNDVRTMYLRMW